MDQAVQAVGNTCFILITNLHSPAAFQLGSSVFLLNSIYKSFTEKEEISYWNGTNLLLKEELGYWHRTNLVDEIWHRTNTNKEISIIKWKLTTHYL